ncbi:MAG: hypothetical protein IJA34_04540 [Lachnospiraceae bacterium]|nr:hypothetical protein [Lachnospiraceae bacterium]
MKKNKCIILIIGICALILGYTTFNFITNSRKHLKEDNINTNATDKDSKEKEINTKAEYIDAEELNANEYNQEFIKTLQYNNLELGETKIYIPKVESVNNISIKGNYPYLGLTDVEEIIDKELEYLDYFIEEEFKEEELWDCTHVISFEETRKQIDEGTYFNENKRFPGLVYGCMDDEQPYSYAHVYEDFSTIWFDRGKISNVLNEEMIFPENRCEIIKKYEINDELDDEYQLLNGSITIREAIDFVENYLNNCMPYEMSKDAQIKVNQVNILEVNDNLYILKFLATRNYKGINFEWGGFAFDCGKDDYYLKDRGFAYMIETDMIDKYLAYANGNTDTIESTGEIKKVVTPKSALDIVSEEIGSNSIYKVSKIELAYRNEIINGVPAEGTEYVGVPCYKITCTNSLDERETYFYVEMETGNISYDSIKGM